MPRFKDASGCFNKEDARELGLTAAVIWYDILNSSELFETNPIWYDQRKAGDRLGIPYQTISRAIKTLEEVGRISVRVGYRPNSTIKTTWITILVEDLDEHQKSQNEISKKSQNEISILKETNKKDSSLNGCHEVEADKERMKPIVLYQRVKSIFRQRKDVDKKTCLDGIKKLQERLDDESILELAAYCASDKFKPINREDGSSWKPNFFWFTSPDKTESVVNTFKGTPSLYQEKRRLKY